MHNLPSTSNPTYCFQDPIIFSNNQTSIITVKVPDDESNSQIITPSLPSQWERAASEIEHNQLVTDTIHQFKKHAIRNFDHSHASHLATILCEQGAKRIDMFLRGVPFTCQGNRVVFQDTYDSLYVVYPLIEFLAQQETAGQATIRGQVIKATRLFAECLAFQNLYEDIHNERTRLSHEIIDKFLATCEATRTLLTTKDVVLKHELECACSAFKLICTNENKISKYTDLCANLIAAIGNQSVGDIIQFSASLAKAVYDEIPFNQEYGEIRLISWTSRAIVGQNSTLTLNDFYKHIGSYRTSSKVAFCSLEALITLFDQAYQKEEPSFKIYLKGKDDKPGIVTFVTLFNPQDNLLKEKIKIAKVVDAKLAKLKEGYKKFKGSKQGSGLVGAMDPFWEVRYRAISYLHLIFDGLKASLKRKITKILALQVGLEGVPPVLQLLKEIRDRSQTTFDPTLDANDGHIQKCIEENKRKYEETLTIGKRKLKNELKKGTANESNADEISEDSISLSEEQQLELLELELLKEKLNAENYKIENFF